MPTLKQIKMRLKAVTNIKKITMSMKVVSAAKFAKAEKELVLARAYGAGAQAFFDKSECSQDEKAPKHLVVALTSDRGLCGAVHSNIARRIRAMEKPPHTETKLVCIGDKAKTQLRRTHHDQILMHFNDIGKTMPTFTDAGTVATEILACGYEFDHGELLFNKFRNVASQHVTVLPLYSDAAVAGAEKLSLYDSIDEQVLKNYREFALAANVFYAMKENAASEQAARMTAMDGASKNAGEMIDKLTMQYNRSRQAVITKELIEIISGADAIKD